MTNALSQENTEEAVFMPGPALSAGPEFQQRLSLFLDDLGSSSVKLFGNFWFEKVEGDRPPTWPSLQPHTRPDLILSAFVLERPVGSARIFIRFIGNDLIETLGGEITGLALDEITQDETLTRWNAANTYCFDKQAVSAVDFDLGFAGRHFKKATTVMFPLQSDTDVDLLLGYALWRN